MLLPYSEQLSISDIPFSMQVMFLSGAAIADGSQIEREVPTFAKAGPAPGQTGWCWQ